MFCRSFPVTVALVVLVAVPFLASCEAHSSSTAAVAGATHKGRGVVVVVNVEKARIKINHEKIDGFMEPMTMWFDVKDASMLSGIAPSDKVEFTITEEAAADVITELRKIPS
jgi:Cu/Ag efflux protein CusF